MTWYGTIAWISPPLGNEFSGIVLDGLDMCAKWTISACQNSFYEQNARLVGAVLLMRQENNGRIRSLPTWRLIYPGTFTPWWRAPAWQLSAAHGRGYGTTSPVSTNVVINQASGTSRWLERRWISADPIWSNNHFEVTYPEDEHTTFCS